MNLANALKILGKILLGALAFFGGTLLGGMVAGMAGLPVPALPAGADAATLMWLQLIAGVLFSGALALLSRSLTTGFLPRWIILTLFGWITYGLNTYLEAAIFTAYEAASAYTLLMQFFAAALSGGVIAWFFHPAQQGEALGTAVRAFAAQFTAAQWVVRLLASLAAFPLIYLAFGLLARPFILTYYEQQMAGLTLPGWEEILPTLFLRSLLFLLACLPPVITWQGSRRSLFLALGSALFMLVGGIYMIQSYWFPVTMRLVHGLEILADSFVYSGVLTVLLVRKTGQRPVEPANLENRGPHKIRTS